MTSIPVQPVIMAGGSGTRLWPLSRAQHPKQFLVLQGNRVISPPITATAIGERKLGSALNPNASGSMPTPIAIVVITIGRLRL